VGRSGNGDLHFVRRTSFCQVAIRDSRTTIDVLVNVVQTAEVSTSTVHYLRDEEKFVCIKFSSSQVLQEAMRLPSVLNQLIQTPWPEMFQILEA